MKNHIDRRLATSVGIALCVALMMSVPVVADDVDAVRAVKMDPEKLAGIDLPAEEPFMDAEDVLEGSHRPRGEILYYGDQLIVEVYEDDPATLRFDEPYIYDEFVTVLSGKVIVTADDGVSQEFVAGDTFVVPKGFTGTWQMLGNFRELIVIERQAYEEAYGTTAD
ncbi:MAG: DUF861 domain-containing protein [Proteobacteria bacterium]|nr:DUF861 domain-containing protein [Pseudomonadota bacterium]